MKTATQNALELIRRTIPALPTLAEKACPCQSALALAIWSDTARLPAPVREKLRPLLGKYLAR